MQMGVPTAVNRIPTENNSFRQFLIGQSQATQQLCEIIQLVASRKMTVLITGETGTGKEVVARALHAASNRSAQAMVSVNCTALPGQLIESELFGNVRGAFTGAEKSRAGRFEQAHRGTLFLDEIGDLPLESQGKLLRVLQEQTFERLGSSETVRVDVRVVAATNLDLEKAVEEKRFREDLFYRLNVVPIRLTPLRERPDDIPALVEHLLEKIRAAEMMPGKRVSEEALDYLLQQPWPGNVRQLEHSLQMAVALSGNREMLEVTDFAQARPAAKPAASLQGATPVLGPAGIDFEETIVGIERSLLEQALRLSGGNKAKAAELLRMKRTTLLAKMKSLEERDLAQISSALRAPLNPSPASPSLLM